MLLTIPADRPPMPATRVRFLPSRYFTLAIIGAVAALIFEFWILFADVHFIWTPPRTSTPQIKIATIAQSSHVVRVKSPLQLTWTEANTGAELYEGDEVATLDGASAQLKFVDGRTLSLGPNSLVVLSRTRVLSNRTFSLTLIKGTLLQSKMPDSSSSAGPLAIRVGRETLISNATASFTIENQVGGPAVKVQEGKLERIADLAARPAVSGGNEEPASPVRPTAPILWYPAASAIIENPESIELSWSAGTARNHGSPGNGWLYIVQVASDPKFDTLDLNRSVTGKASISFVPPRKGKFFWRVLVSTGDGRALASEVRELEVRRNLERPRLARPRVEKSIPENRKKLDAPLLEKPSIKYQEGSRLRHWLRLVLDAIIPNARAEEPTKTDDERSRYTVRLNWMPVRGAHIYVLQIASDANFSHLVAEKIINEPSYAWRSNVAGYYYWRVAAIDSDGDRGPYSEYMTFSILAERNQAGDESTYDTYLQFDEYSRHKSQFRLLGGIQYSTYHFWSNDTTNSPSDIRYTATTFKQLQIEYAYRIDNHYSLQFSLRTDAKTLTSTNFSDRPNQNTLHLNETALGLGMERRYFYPSHYFMFQTGIRMTFIDIPVLEPPAQLNLQTFSFVGAYSFFGIAKQVWRHYEFSSKAGGILQYADSSLRYGPSGATSFMRNVNENFAVGLRADYEYRFYTFGSDNLSGHARNFSTRGFLVLEFMF